MKKLANKNMTKEINATSVVAFYEACLQTIFKLTDEAQFPKGDSWHDPAEWITGLTAKEVRKLKRLRKKAGL